MHELSLMDIELIFLQLKSFRVSTFDNREELIFDYASKNRFQEIRSV